MAVVTTLLCSVCFAATFNDLTADHWAYMPIKEMADKGILSGYPDGTFRPNGAITRAEFAKILVLSLNLSGSQVNVEFEDVPSEHWAYSYVKKASDYLSGYTNGVVLRYMPDNKAVREDMTVAIVNAAGLQNADYSLSTLNRFSDKNDISESLKKYVAIAVENGLMKGNDDGTFRPKGNLTRAQVCQLMKNALEYLEKIPVSEIVTPTPSPTQESIEPFSDIVFNPDDLTLDLGTYWDKYEFGIGVTPNEAYKASQRVLVNNAKDNNYSKKLKGYNVICSSQDLVDQYGISLQYQGRKKKLDVNPFPLYAVVEATNTKWGYLTDRVVSAYANGGKFTVVGISQVNDIASITYYFEEDGASSAKEVLADSSNKRSALAMATTINVQPNKHLLKVTVKDVKGNTSPVQDFYICTVEDVIDIRMYNHTTGEEITSNKTISYDDDIEVVLSRELRNGERIEIGWPWNLSYRDKTFTFGLKELVEKNNKQQSLINEPIKITCYQHNGGYQIAKYNKNTITWNGEASSYDSEVPQYVEENYYRNALDSMVEAGIVNRYPDGTFKPNMTVTRAEMAKFLVTIRGLTDPMTRNSFSDVSRNHWAYDFVQIATEQGYMDGYPDGTFKPNAEMTGAEALTYLVRLLGHGDRTEKIGTWPTNYIHMGTELGLTEGIKSAFTYEPLTRDTLVTLLYNTYVHQITRAEMAKWIVEWKGLGYYYSYQTNYSDVAKNHWASGYIQSAAEAGYLNGYPDGTFKPEGTLTYNETLTIMVRLLGLQEVVESSGTWPTNYINKARELGLLDGIGRINYSDTLTSGVLFKLWNNLDAANESLDEMMTITPTATQTIKQGQLLNFTLSRELRTGEKVQINASVEDKGFVTSQGVKTNGTKGTFNTDKLWELFRANRSGFNFDKKEVKVVFYVRDESGYALASGSINATISDPIAIEGSTGNIYGADDTIEIELNRKPCNDEEITVFYCYNDKGGGYGIRNVEIHNSMISFLGKDLIEAYEKSKNTAGATQDNQGVFPVIVSCKRGNQIVKLDVGNIILQ